MADRDDLLVSQAVHACFVALGGLQVVGDLNSLGPSQQRGVFIPEHNSRAIYSDTLWTERNSLGEQVKVRHRVKVSVEIETLYF